MVRREVNIDEEWPVFTLEQPKNISGPFTVEISDDEYKEYLSTVYKYRHWQLKLQGLYESSQREYNKTNSGEHVSEGGESVERGSPKENRDAASKEQLSAFLFKSNA